MAAASEAGKPAGAGGGKYSWEFSSPTTVVPDRLVMELPVASIRRPLAQTKIHGKLIITIIIIIITISRMHNIVVAI